MLSSKITTSSRTKALCPADFGVEAIFLSTNFYKNLLGIEPIELDEKFCSFQIGDSFFNLHLAYELSPVSAGGSVRYFLVERSEVILERAKIFGGELYRGPLDVRETGRRICQIKDPYENVLGFEEVIK